MKPRFAGLVAVVVLTACQGGQPASPASSPLPPGELVFMAQADGGHVVMEARDGSGVAQLPPATLAMAVNEGGDVAEAYLAAAEPDGLRTLTIGRPFTTIRIAAGPPAGNVRAAIVPAPGLLTFVGRKDVLIAMFPDGSLHGYQAGRPLWTRPAGIARDLMQVGDFAVIQVANGWAQLAPETGTISGMAGGCLPVAAWAGAPAQVCAGPSLVAAKRTAKLPAGAHGTAWLLRPVRQTDVYVYFSGGELCRVGGAVTCATAMKAADSARPALTPDGRFLYLPVGKSVFEQPVGGGQTREIRAGVSYLALASSRDGTMLYGLGGGHLDIWTLGSTPTRIRSYPAEARDITLVAGG